MTGERDFELANDIAERQRQAGIARVRASLRSIDTDEANEGPRICDCGEPIDEGRRRAMPNARDCIQCATFLEQRRRRA